MNIAGITTCVGELYANYLREALPVWLKTLDSLTIVTDTSGSNVLWFLALFGAKIIHTDAFTRNGAHFNKGAALNQGIAAAAPTDWILSFDADILPPANWRQIAERRAQRDCLNGAHRYKPNAKQTNKNAIFCKGYFQLWHVEDPHYRRSPIFDDSFDAGGYDTAFASQWPRRLHNNLGFGVTHLGEKCRYWCGPGTTPEQQQEAMERYKARSEQTLAARAKRAPIGNP
jgi:hypothetical protein